MEYLTDGISESIINTLSQLPKLRVVSRSTAFRYKGQEVDPQEVGRQLGVRAVLTGRVRQVGDSLVIGVELIDVANDAQLWGEHYRREFSNIFDVQGEIAREISEKLRLKLTSEDKRRLTRRHTGNPEAYQLYLRGRFFWNKRTPEGFKKAIEYFQQAIESDPGYALAYAGLADCYALLGGVVYSVSPPKEIMPKAKAAALKALELDNTLAEAHASLGLISISYDWDWSEAEKEFERAFELNPNYATAHHWYAEYLMMTGRLDEAVAELQRAQELDPLSLVINANLGAAHYFARRYDQAVEPLRRTIEMDSKFYLAHYFMGLVYEQKREFPEAIAELQEAIRLDESPDALGALGHTYAASNNKDGALKILGELIEMSKRRYVSPYNMALIYAGLDDKEQAFGWLRKSYEERSGWLAWIKVEPQLDNLRQEPRFTKLVRDIGHIQ
jgi:TolB-like protein/Tfp pilus assembly protein PilF